MMQKLGRLVARHEDLVTDLSDRQTAELSLWQDMNVCLRVNTVGREGPLRITFNYLSPESDVKLSDDLIKSAMTVVHGWSQVDGTN